MTRTDEDDQRTSTSVDDVPEDPPEPPPPPDKPARRRTQPPSVELEGERRSQSSFEDELTSAEANASQVSGNVEDVGKHLKKLRK